MMQNDWTHFTLKVYIKASIAEVYALWSVPALLEKWFLRTATFADQFGRLRGERECIAAGDTYRWLWHGHSDEAAEQGKIISANNQDVIEFIFGNAGTVSVSLSHDNGWTAVVLQQTNIPNDETGRKNYYVGCSTGWTFYLANLKAVMESEIDLRNKNLEFRNVINA
jgi:uncharacterized protein YndB with AHSA1/START domain